MLTCAIELASFHYLVLQLALLNSPLYLPHMLLATLLAHHLVSLIGSAVARFIASGLLLEPAALFALKVSGARRKGLDRQRMVEFSNHLWILCLDSRGRRSLSGLPWRTSSLLRTRI